MRRQEHIFQLPNVPGGKSINGFGTETVKTKGTRNDDMLTWSIFFYDKSSKEAATTPNIQKLDEIARFDGY